MEVKANVQRRRQERIRELQSRSGQEAAAGSGRITSRPELSPVPPHQEDGHAPVPPLYVRGPLDEEEHGGDPELAWKQREKQLLQWYSREERSGFEAGDGGSRRGAVRDGEGPGGGPFKKLFKVKLIIAVVLFAGACAVFWLDAPWARQAQTYITGALTEDMDFARIAAWYEKTFSGSPSLLPAFGNKQEAAKVQGEAARNRFVQPAKGTVVQPFEDKQEGVWLSTRQDAQAAAMDEGRIEFVGDRPGIGHTIMIRHAEGYRTTYGGLKPTKWETGDWVKAGEVIGTVTADDEGKGALYFAVMKDERFVNPLDVVSID